MIEKFLESGREVVVPYISSESKKMLHSVLSDFRNIHPGVYGVPEPSVIKDADITQIRAVIVPLCAFDGFGHRLGYGKGYYDMFLSSLPKDVMKIGLAFSIQEVDKIPHEEHDTRLDMIITEHGVSHASDELV